MSRRESLVGGEVVAEDVAEQAEKKRKQDEAVRILMRL
jgi:hypothetical protein